MEFLNVLTRNEMKNVKGGGSCRIKGSSGWSDCDWDPAGAQSFFHGFSEIVAYCCASCGRPGFASAAPCGPGEPT